MMYSILFSLFISVPPPLRIINDLTAHEPGHFQSANKFWPMTICTGIDIDAVLNL